MGRTWAALVVLAFAWGSLGGAGVTRAGFVGPDGGGYWAEDSDEPGGPAFSFEPLPPTATPLDGCDDCLWGPFPLGFAFNFYDAAYDQAWISSNGFLTFDSGSGDGCCAGTNLPDPAAPRALIAGYWDDLVPGMVRFATVGAAPARVFVVEFDAAAQYRPEGPPVTMQIKLFEGTGAIEVHHLLASTTPLNPVVAVDPQAPPEGIVGVDFSAPAIGVQDAAGVRGLSYRFGPTHFAAHAVRFLAQGSARTPLAPEDVHAGAPTDPRTVLTWRAPAFDGGSPVTGYRVYRTTEREGTVLLGQTPADVHAYADDACAPAAGCVARYAVAAVNAIGEGLRGGGITVAPYDGSLVPSIAYNGPCSRALVQDLSTGRSDPNGPKDPPGTDEIHWKDRYASQNVLKTMKKHPDWVEAPTAAWITGITFPSDPYFGGWFEIPFTVDTSLYADYTISIQTAVYGAGALYLQPPSGSPIVLTALGGPKALQTSVLGSNWFQQDGTYKLIINAASLQPPAILVTGGLYATPREFHVPLGTGVDWDSKVVLLSGVEDPQWAFWGGPAYVVGMDASSVGWAANPSFGSQWINPTGVATHNFIDGLYRYERTFELPYVYLDAKLSLGYAADDAVEFYVGPSGEPNPVDVGGGAGAGSWHTLPDVTTPLVPGFNTLRADVTNAPGGADPTGLNVEGSVSGHCAV